MTTIVEESLDQMWKDVQPLLAQHWEEITATPDIPLLVDRAFYERAEAAGKLCLVIARNTDGAIVGYAVFIIGQNAHYSTSLQALQDVFYVEPSARGAMIGLKLITTSEAILRARGCQLVYHHVKLKHPALGQLLARRGYVPMETIFSKRLDVI